jgi:la-related protein 1
MSSIQSRPSGEGAPVAPPVVSYAQAAKGQTASTTASALQSSQITTSGISTPAKETSSAVNTPSGGSERGDRSVNGSFESAGKVDQPTESSSLELQVPTSSKPEASLGSPSFGTSTLPKEDKEEKEDDFTLVGGALSNSARDPNSQNGSTSNEKPAESTEGRRGKKGKKQRNNEKEVEKEKEELKPEILVPAPLPAVNFWQQRREELAKVKPTNPVAVQSVQPSLDGSIPNESALPQAPKNVDAKKRGKSSGVEDNERNMSTAQNGAVKETTNSSKGQKKGADGSGKAKEDQSNKRSGPRGSRGNDREEKSLPNPLPPPVEDAMSWPTPETALEEEKRKAQEKEKSEREEKDETTSNKPRPKEKWVAVPYIPTVTFNTPIPPRGGRGRGGGARLGRTEGGGRPSHSATGNATGDKAQPNSTANGPTDLEKKTTTRSNSLPPNSKRQGSEQINARDQRKPSTAGPTEKSKGGLSKSESSATFQAHNNASSSQADPTLEGNQDLHLPPGESSKSLKPDQVQANVSNDGYSQSRAGTADRRSEPSLRGSDPFNEGSNLSKESPHQSRDRAERSDRGRVGVRGRGGHSFPNGQPHLQQIFTNGHGPQPPNGYPIRQSTGPYSPPLQPPPFGNQYFQPPARNPRGSRTQSIPNNAVFGRFTPNGGPGSQHMPPLQTSNPMFDYQSLQSMSAVPYNPYIDQASVLAMVTMQLEYYFSIDNLCKDVYLRKHMDSQGFVFLSFIAGFKRIQALSQESDLLRYACQESEIIEYLRDDKGVDRLRRRDGWEKWVLSMDERDESVRNDGPTFFPPQQPQRSQHIAQSMMPGHQSMSPQTFPHNGGEPFRLYSNGAPVAPLLNGNGNSYAPETPLSAAVPDFAPSLLPLNGISDPLDAETTFNDDEVGHLRLVFAFPKNTDDTKPKSPFSSAPSRSLRTFSNGSIDGRSIAEEIYDDPRQGRALTNGSRVSET